MTKKNTVLNAVMCLIVGLVLSVATSGCKNTAHGAGEDIEDMGEKIQEKTD